MTFETHRHFHDELSAVKVRLLTMSGEAEAALGLAVEALLERDADKARHVIVNDRAIDNMEMEIEEDHVKNFSEMKLVPIPKLGKDSF